nr:DUF533 domain-containing protein [Pararoseomonas baculiformis]
MQDVLGGLLGGGIGSLGGDAHRRGAGGPLGRMGDEDGTRGGRGFGGPIGSMGGAGGGLGGGLGGMLGGGGLGGALGTAAAGGLLGSLLGGRRRGSGGGLLRMGGVAVLGTLAYRAWQQWQESQQAGAQASGDAPGHAAAGSGSRPTSGPWSGQPSSAGPAAAAPLPPPEEFAREEAPAADGHPFGLSLVKAMIAAAKADGHLDDNERAYVFEEVERLELDAEAKGFVFQALEAAADPSAVAAMARTDAQKSEIYMVSRLVAEPDTAAERAYLDALAHRLGLAPGLRQSLDAQAAEAQRLLAAQDTPGQGG